MSESVRLIHISESNWEKALVVFRDEIAFREIVPNSLRVTVDHSFLGLRKRVHIMCLASEVKAELRYKAGIEAMSRKAE
jgi:hypothetical protein